MKRILFIIICSLLIVGCSSDDEVTENKVLGQWKLVEIQQYGENPEGTTINLQDLDIMYNFTNDNILTVIGADDSAYMAYTDGTYEYEYYPGSSNSSINHTQPLYESVIIENLRWDFRLEGEKMSLSLAHVDGSTLFFDSWK